MEPNAMGRDSPLLDVLSQRLDGHLSGMLSFGFCTKQQRKASSLLVFQEIFYRSQQAWY